MSQGGSGWGRVYPLRPGSQPCGDVGEDVFELLLDAPIEILGDFLRHTVKMFGWYTARGEFEKAEQSLRVATAINGRMRDVLRAAKADTSK